MEVFTSEHYEEAYELWDTTVGIGLGTGDGKEEIIRFLKRNQNFSFIASVTGQMVGTILAGHDGRRGYLYHLAVIKKYRNMGIGNKLIQTCLQALQKEGILKCHLFVYNNNTEAQAFWSHNGWSLRNDLLVMSKNMELL